MFWGSEKRPKNTDELAVHITHAIINIQKNILMLGVVGLFIYFNQKLMDKHAQKIGCFNPFYEIY